MGVVIMEMLPKIVEAASKSAENMTSSCFDYCQLGESEAALAKSTAIEIRSLQLQTARLQLEIGAMLLRVKDKLGHGHFGAWLRHECDLEQRTANRYMAIALVLDGRFDSVSNLPVTTLYALADKSVPPELREEIILRFEDGKMTEAGVKAALDVGKMSPSPPTPSLLPAHSSTRTQAQVRLARVVQRHLQFDYHDFCSLLSEAGFSEMENLLVEILGKPAKSEKEPKPEQSDTHDFGFPHVTSPIDRR